MHLLETVKDTRSAQKKRDNLRKVLDFVGLTLSFRRVERDIPLSKEKRRENTTEHSYQLAVVSWYMAGIEGLALDMNKVIKYALVHDLVEVYAGDTPLYSLDEAYVKSKSAREKEAAVRIEQQFPEFSELHHLIHEYEERSDEESRFVYAVDKLLPVVSIYLNGGHAWKSHGISVDMIVDKTASRISSVPEVKGYFDEMITAIRERPEYFATAA